MKIQTYVQSLRRFRVWHRGIGLLVAVFLLVSSVTGILLALKKEVDLIQPPTQKGISKELSAWMPLQKLAQIANTEFYRVHPNQVGNKIDRMDVRPAKGIVKVLYKEANWEVQLDGANGEVRSIAKRHSDWIEQLHDGSIISDWFKLGSMHFLGLGAIFSIISGIWLWYGPKKYRKLKRRKRKQLLEQG